MSVHLWLGFLAATLVVALSPGPGAVLSMSVGLRHGYWHALRGILGLQTALVLQLALVFAGLGALLAASENAFVLLKLAGAAYLVWLGIQKWRAPAVPEGEGLADVPAPGGFYRQGVLVNLGNPKAIVFIAALVPQFIDASAPRLLQFVVMVATMCSIDILVMSGYAVLASRFRRVAGSARAVRLQNRVFGGLFVSAGLLLAGTSRS
ncbi:LysE family transporter [Zoogloea sp.]|uniref:LysE family transporter n=1 Tax=Zoogloea sp. TaxID=49181 RepID=UPI0014163A49|nr:MAG: homoserine/homoserine lactone efflux protein [Zoogloea sp.]